MKYSVSVIIPIYNVAQFIEKCAISLFEQTLTDLEFIFVNDSTPDNSIEILRQVMLDYPSLVPRIKIIQHSQNQGLPSARNTGLKEAEGDYIFHCDSDDWVEKNMLKDMLKIAIENDADVVYSDYYLSFKSNERYMKQPQVTDSDDFVKTIMMGKMKYNVWNKLIKRSLYLENKIQFPSGHSMGEDMTMIKLMSKANRIFYLPNAFYHYVQMNNDSFTKKFTDQHLEQILYNAADTIKFLEINNQDGKFKKEINFFKLNIKLPFLIDADQSMYKLWRDLYPESNSYIKENPGFSARIKFIQLAALNNQDWLVYLYNKVIVNFIYGIIYR